jgi:LysM repeat protein
MIDGEEVELKAVISLDTIAFSMKEGRLITDVEEKPCDYEKRKEIPGIAGYVVGKGDTLWNIAKIYGSTPEEIKKTNNLTEGELKEGQKLLIMKKVKEIL